MTSPERDIQGFIEARYPGAQLSEEQDIFEIGFINSLFAAELVMYVESTFDLVIPNDELTIDNFRSVRAAADLVRRLTDPQEVAS
jgi:acyl carrier protein